MHVEPRKVRRSKLLCPKRNQPQHDLVETPLALAATIVRHFAPTGRVLDPCRGQGQAFYRALLDSSVSQVEWCEISEGRDFFEWTDRVDWAISNPPWSLMRSFLRHAMEIADNIVFLATLPHFDTRARYRDIAAAGFGRKEALVVPHPPAPWPGSGFLLTAYHLQRGWRGPLTFTELARDPPEIAALQIKNDDGKGRLLRKRVSA
jgi:hypothetical protein